MHGLINCAVERFIRTTYGDEIWSEVAGASGLECTSFEPMLTYPDEITQIVVVSASERLGRPYQALLEDIGTFLVTDPSVEVLRRLLRFGGASYTEFLFSLNELYGRVKLALPDLEVPKLALEPDGDGSYSLVISQGIKGIGYSILGALRAMADDYGSLATVEYDGSSETGEERLRVAVFDAEFARGRAFDLVANL